MDELKVGAMCAGYGGLELGLSYAGFDFQLEWVAESDKWAALVLEERFGVPNLGDITKIESPPAVDVCIAGFPCQPVSHAGTQQGIKDERWLIDDVVRVANAAGARWLFLENVLGIYTANQGNAFGQVLASLAKGGFDARWKSIRADESCGAPHRRNRWFCIAYSSESKIDSKESFADSDGGSYDEERRGRCGGLFGAQEEGEGEGEERQRVWSISSDGFEVVADSTDFGYEWSGGTGSGGNGFENSSVAFTDPDDRRRSFLWEEDGVFEEREGEAYNVKGGSSVVADSDESGSQGEESEGRRYVSTRSVRAACDWGKYESAIRRWEEEFGCVAPQPTEPGRNGGVRLSPVFVEWMMGLPEGWVTGLDIPRTHQLKLLGNGVVPQQAAVAYLELLGVV
jgi:DNA (cytosine-5)-methyltransferase 1